MDNRQKELYGPALTKQHQEIIRSRAEHVQQLREMYLQDASISGIVVLPKLYEQRDFQPAWTTPRNVEGLLRIIGEMDREGLYPAEYHQEPGPSNALGRVKFIFPNKHFVFLHDTPSKGLFERETRTFSSGCIRGENPFHLAEALLKDPENWNLNKIEQLIETGKTKTVYLNKPIPVLLLYATAFHTFDDDYVHFRNDVYDRDQAILKELQEPFKRKEPHLGEN